MEEGPGRRPSRILLRAIFSVSPELVVGATKVFVIGQKPIAATAIGVSTADCIFDRPVVEAGVYSQPTALPMVRSLVAWAGGTKPLSRHRPGRLASLPAQESEGQPQPRLLDSR